MMQITMSLYLIFMNLRTHCLLLIRLRLMISTLEYLVDITNLQSVSRYCVFLSGERALSLDKGSSFSSLKLRMREHL
jgi:hypothetical protein